MQGQSNVTALVNISDTERASRIAGFEALGYGAQEAALHVAYGEIARSKRDATVETESNADEVAASTLASHSARRGKGKN